MANILPWSRKSPALSEEDKARAKMQRAIAPKPVPKLLTELLSADLTKPSYNLVVVTVIAIVIPAVFLILYGANYDYREIVGFMLSANFFAGVSALTLTGLAAWVAALIVGYFQETRTIKLVNGLRALAAPHLIHEFLLDLNHYSQRALNNYSVSVTLRESGFKDVLLCKMDYSYNTTNRQNRSPKLRFNRVTKNEDFAQHKAEVAGLSFSDMYFSFEFRYTLDERTLRGHPNYAEIVKLYNFSGITVNALPISA